MRHRVKIRAFARVLRAACRAHPVNRITARVGGFHHRLRLVTLAEARDFNTLERRMRDIRYIDIEQHRLTQRSLHMTRHHFTCHRTGCGKVVSPRRHQRNCKRRYAQQKTLGRRRHRAGVNGVIAHIGAVIDAGHHHIGHEIEQPRHRQMHAIGGRAVDIEKTVGCLAQREWPVQCE